MLNPCTCSTNTMLSMYIANNTSSICFFAKFTDNRAVFLERNAQAKKNDVLLRADHTYAKIKMSVSILIG